MPISGDVTGLSALGIGFSMRFNVEVSAKDDKRFNFAKARNYKRISKRFGTLTNVHILCALCLSTRVIVDHVMVNVVSFTCLKVQFRLVILND